MKIYLLYLVTVEEKNVKFTYVLKEQPLLPFC